MIVKPDKCLIQNYVVNQGQKHPLLPRESGHNMSEGGIFKLSNHIFERGIGVQDKYELCHHSYCQTCV